MAGGTRQGASTRTRAGLLSCSDTLGMMPAKEGSMRYDYRCTCGHRWEATLPPEARIDRCPKCDTLTAPTIHASALSPSRKTEGKR